MSTADRAARTRAGAPARAGTPARPRVPTQPGAGTLAGVEGPARPVGSVVIPAYDEAAVIGACLGPLARAAAAGTIEVVVVCNGCTDATAEIAGSFPGVRVIELPDGGKPAALRAGDRAVTALPRIYLDADVVLPYESVEAVLDRLAGPDPAPPRDPAAARDPAAVPAQRRSPAGRAVLAARPPVRYDAAGSTWLVRRYYRARARIPAVLGSLWGAGVYALSAPGRSRFDEFPDLVADDLWVDQLFGPEEIEVVACPAVTVTAPRHAPALLRVLSRTYRGKAEHHRLNTGQARETSGGTLRDLARLARTGPVGAFDAAVYLGFALVARLRYRAARRAAWERDDSTRRLLPSPAPPP